VCPRREALQFGGVIGSVFVRDIVTRSDSPWFRKGATALLFADARPELSCRSTARPVCFGSARDQDRDHQAAFDALAATLLLGNVKALAYTAVGAG
jgi:hypothetical protein